MRQNTEGQLAKKNQQKNGRTKRKIFQLPADILCNRQKIIQDELASSVDTFFLTQERNFDLVKLIVSLTLSGTKQTWVSG